VNLLIFVPTSVALKKPKHSVPLPTAEANWLPHKMILPIDRVTRAGGIRDQDLKNLVAQSWRHALIGINDQNPGMSCLRNCPVLLRGGIDVFVLDDAIRIFACDLQRAVSAVGINDEDFVRPFYRFETRADVP
jgi:hypothetical protein